MSLHTPRITLLPEDVQAQIKSSLQITTINEVVEELVKNALDALASTVRIEVDFAKGFCSVLDDGVGIPSMEFLQSGRLAQLHCIQTDLHTRRSQSLTRLLGTSKLDSPNPTYGQYGRFLSNLCTVSLLSITSRYTSEASTNRLVLNGGQPISRQLDVDEDEGGPAGHGTKVTVHNLFGNLPVQLKHRASRFSSRLEIEKEFHTVKRSLASLLLASPRSVELHLKVAHGKQSYSHRPVASPENGVFSLPRICSTLCQAGYISPSGPISWRVGSVRAGDLFIRAAICLDPAPSKGVQFMSVGHLPIHPSGHAHSLFEIVNNMFDASDFGSVEKDMAAEEGQNSYGSTKGDSGGDKPSATRELTPSGKGVDRWPMFYIRVDGTPGTVIQDLESQNIASHDFQHLVRTMEALITQFLDVYGYKSDSGRKRRWRNHKHRRPEARDAGIDPHVGRAHAARPPGRFQDWRRVKNTRNVTFGDLNMGLPFGKLELDHASTELDAGDEPDDHISADEPVLGTNSDDDAAERTGTRQKDESRERAAEYERGLSWTNPRPGIVVQRKPHAGFPRRDPASPVSLGSPSGGHRGEDSLMTPLSNPISSPPLEDEIPALDKGQFDHHPAWGDLGLASDQKLTKASLSSASVLRQVDDKFILAIVAATGPNKEQREISTDDGREKGAMLVLIDQHAADERIRVEELYDQLCRDDVVTLPRPIVFEVNRVEAAKFLKLQTYLRSWDLVYDVRSDSSSARDLVPGRTSPALYGESQSAHSVVVTGLPRLIAERCWLEPKILIDLLRKEIWTERPRRGRDVASDRSPPVQEDSSPWLSKIAHCPSGLLDMLHSRSCRSAIMFNDSLTVEQCTTLVQRLARCAFPFQCAHGRPSMVVLMQADGEESVPGAGDTGTPIHARGGFGHAWNRWREGS